MASKIIRSILANEDIANIVGYLSERNPSVAERFYEALKSTENLFLTTPKIGAVRSYNNPMLADMRMFPVSNFDKFLIYYRPVDDGVLIIRVLHGARDIQSEFDITI